LIFLTIKTVVVRNVEYDFLAQFLSWFLFRSPRGTFIRLQHTRHSILAVLQVCHKINGKCKRSYDTYRLKYVAGK